MLLFTTVTLAILSHAVAVQDALPIATQIGDYGAHPVLGFSPMPTDFARSHPKKLFKRAPATALCAYISGNPYNQLSCAGTSFCGVQLSLSVLGCCPGSVALSGDSYSLTGCGFRTTCYDSAQAPSCTGTCAGDQQVALCTRSNAPYCLKYTIVDGSLSYFRCTDVPSSTIVANFSYDRSSQFGSSTGTVSQAPTAEGFPSATSGVGGGGQSASPSSTEAPNNSGGGGGNSVLGPAVGGAVGGTAVLLIAIGAGVWFWLKHKKITKTEKQPETSSDSTTSGTDGAAAAAAAGGAYHANTHGHNEFYKVPVENGQHPNGEAPPTYGSPHHAPSHMSNGYFPLANPAGYHDSPTGSPYHGPQVLAEADGKQVHTPVQSPGPRSNTASPSGFGSERHARSDGTASELEGPTSMISPNMGPTPGHTMSPVSQPHSPGPQLGHAAGNPNDWNAPLHELPGNPKTD